MAHGSETAGRAGKSPRPVSDGRGKGGRGQCIISNFGAESTLSLGVSMPGLRLRARGTRRGLPSGTAELRRRIITFYVDFNTRLRSASPSLTVRRRAYTVAPLRDFESSIPRYRLPPTPFATERRRILLSALLCRPPLISFSFSYYCLSLWIFLFLSPAAQRS